MSQGAPFTPISDAWMLQKAKNLGCFANAQTSLPSKLNVSHAGCRFSTAIVLCDQSWVDPDLDDTNGIQVREQRDMLRLESQILLVQLHIRKNLAVSCPESDPPGPCASGRQMLSARCSACSLLCKVVPVHLSMQLSHMVSCQDAGMFLRSHIVQHAAVS
jgi:hypothetical protein